MNILLLWVICFFIMIGKIGIKSIISDQPISSLILIFLFGSALFLVMIGSGIGKLLGD